MRWKGSVIGLEDTGGKKGAVYNVGGSGVKNNFDFKRKNKHTQKNIK